MGRIALLLALASLPLINVGAAKATTIFTFDDIVVSGVTEVDLTNQYAGLTFTGARVLNSPGQLNDVTFPPYTSPNVIANDADGYGGVITLIFDTPVTSVGAYATTLSPLTLFAYSGSSLLSTATLSPPNYANGGAGTPNEFLSVSDPGITSVQFFDGNFGSFTLDNLTINGGTFTNASTVPEPATWAIFVLGLYAVGRILRDRRAHVRPDA